MKQSELNAYIALAGYVAVVIVAIFVIAVAIHNHKQVNHIRAKKDFEEIRDTILNVQFNGDLTNAREKIDWFYFKYTSKINRPLLDDYNTKLLRLYWSRPDVHGSTPYGLKGMEASLNDWKRKHSQ